MTSPQTTSTPAAPAPGTPLLEVDDLHVEFRQRSGVVNAVNGVSYELAAGQTLAILGESGSGKSVSAQAIMGILDTPPAVIRGGIRFEGRDMLTMPAEEQRKIRGPGISMIFQDALSSLNPVYSVGWQIGEMFRVHRGASRKEAKQKAIELMDRVRIPAAARRVNDYPHQFSGGMRQRVMIAMAMSCDPSLLIADEPTTALDVTVQAQILDLIRDLQREFNSAVIIITHDLGVVAELADDILVMYAGRAVENGSAETVFGAPEHPYTWGLLSSMPRLDRDRQSRLLPITGTPPSLINVPPGCAFSPRCAYCTRTGGRSTTEVPLLLESGPRHRVACHLDPEERRQIWTDEVQPHL